MKASEVPAPPNSSERRGVLDKLNGLSKAVNIGTFATGLVVFVAAPVLGTAIATAGAVGYGVDRFVADPLISKFNKFRSRNKNSIGQTATRGQLTLAA